MPDYEALRASLVARLDEGDRGDRGWFLITRVHLSPARVKGLCDYLAALGRTSAQTLRGTDYTRMGRLAGVSAADPGIAIRRHYLLALELPLQLIRRTRGNSWAEIELTDRGRQLADSEQTNEVLEQVLSDIMFCRAPWYSGTRIQQYSEFDVPPYAVTKMVLTSTGGWIDRDEFDLFTSRIRNSDEVEQAAQYIAAYRQLDHEQRIALRNEVRSRIPSPKTYQNWRDLSLHTFSLFSLGTTLVRDGVVLRLTASATTGQAEVPSGGLKPTQPALAPLLTIPEVPLSEELLSPPAEPATNSGADAELLIGKLLRADGWSVGYYSNKRGFGFDLWAQRDQAGLVIEVKSSVDRMATVVLTPTEYEAAVHYRENYILAIVEQVLTPNPVIRTIQDPVSCTDIEGRESLEYIIRRASWEAAATPAQFPTSGGT